MGEEQILEDKQEYVDNIHCTFCLGKICSRTFTNPHINTVYLIFCALL